jgi:hypothetical protein
MMQVFYRRRGVAEQQERSRVVQVLRVPRRRDVDYFSQCVVLNFSGSKTASSNLTFAWISE